MGDLNAVRDAVLNGVMTLVKDSCSVIFLVILMFWKCFDMALVTFLLFPIAFYPIGYFGKKIKKIFFQTAIVKSHNMEKVESQKVKDGVDMISDTHVKMAINNNILSLLIEFFGGVAIAYRIRIVLSS
ncbi:MAG: hypothetical protein LBN01_03770 [Endomicrobium sp.]|nr:hypothetical protein [Endomicrobium sp.]